MFELLADITSPAEIPVFGGRPRVAISSDLQFGRIQESSLSNSISITRTSRWSSIFSNIHPVVPSDSEAHQFLMRHFIEPQLESIATQPRSGSVVSAVDGLLMLGEHSRALHLLESHKREESDFWINHAYAMALRYAGKAEQSKEILNQLVAATPDDYRSWHALGRVHIEESQWALADNVFAKAVSILSETQETDPLLLNDFATVAIAEDNTQKAIKLLRQALMEDECCALAWNNLGVCYRKLNKLRRARQFFMTAIKCDPRCAPSVHNLAECDIGKGDYRSAVTLLERHLKNVPDDLQAQERLSWAYFRLGHEGKAITLLKDMIKKHGDEPAALNNLAMIYAQHNRVREAEESFIGAVNLRCNDPQIKYNYASFLYNRNRWEDVVTLFHPIHDLTHISSIILLAHALLKLDRAHHAEDLLSTHRAKFDIDERLPILLSHILTVETDEAERAIEILCKALICFPNDPNIINNLAYAYLILGNTEEARALLAPWIEEKRLPSTTSGTCILASWGLLRIQEGALDEGIRFYQLARSRASGSFKTAIEQKMLLEEGKYYLRVNQIDLALTKLRKSARITAVKGFAKEASRLMLTKGILN